VLILFEVDYPRTHNIQFLLEHLPANIMEPPAEKKLLGLSSYAISTRYPSEFDNLTENEWKEAVSLAGKVIEWAKKLIDSFPAK